MRHRFQIGTIVGDANITVRYQKGGYIGTIEESFISKLTPGDVFTFAGRNLEFIRVKGMVARVKASSKRTSQSTQLDGWQAYPLIRNVQIAERGIVYRRDEYQ